MILSSTGWNWGWKRAFVGSKGTFAKAAKTAEVFLDCIQLNTSPDVPQPRVDEALYQCCAAKLGVSGVQL